jgi:GH25 family lysozyme M1 (1,4-beta-N-acetylmuramidase)
MVRRLAPWRRKSRVTPVLRGVDTSNNQPHPIDWGAVKKDGASFAFLKATEGIGFKDRYFDGDWLALNKAELLRGCYHFALPQYNNPLREATFFLSVVGQLETYDMVVLDLEVGGGPDICDWALAWLQDVEAALGVPPLLYTYLSYADSYLRDPRLARYPLWCAAYGPDCPPRAGAWETVTIWQRTSHATYKGIQGPVDENVLARDLAGLRQLGKQPPAPPPPPPPVARKWLVLVDMRLRPTPDYESSFWPPQMCFKGAVLNGTGMVKGPWIEVVAGGRTGWLLRDNLKSVK